jgi:hypothetical protein
MTHLELQKLILFAAGLAVAAMGASPGPPESQVIISEFMANKGSSLTARVDGQWVRPDWIEIYNGTAQTVNLEGWHLTDSRNDLARWRMPRLIISSGRHQVVFASDKDQKYHPGNYPYFDGTSYHTNFELDRDGEYLALVMPDGATVAHAYEPKYPPQPGYVSYGVCDTGDGYGYFPNPTPGAGNSETCLREVVADTKFSHDRGFYDAPFSVSVTTRTHDATIRYTTDGSTPSETRGRTYHGPISISTTTTLRAMAFKPGSLPTDVDTQSYIFLADVVRQTGAGFPDTWGHKGADYEMDPLVVADYAGTIKDDLKAVPTVSLVTDVNSWFSRSDGIYANPGWEDRYEEEAERPVSVEFFDPGETLGQFQIDAAVRIAGGSSTGGWKSDKLSMRLKFQEPHGPTKLNFPLFEEGAADRFDTLVLDARLNNAWNYGNNDTQRRRAQYTRDQFTSDIQNALGGYGHHGQHVHLYLNGLYWGLYNLHERPDESFAASYFGGNKKDYDVIKHNQGTVVNGSNAYYRRMFDIANGNLATAVQYELLKQHLDVPDFIDYMITNFYYGNTDWAHQNWYASRSLHDPEGRWRYHSWDAEKGMQGLNDNVTGKDNGYGSPSYLHQRLKTNAEYRLLFADHIHRHFFNDGTLTVDGATTLYQRRLDMVDRAVVGESARWGDNRIEQGGIRYTRDQHWVAQRDWLLNTYFPQRTNIVLNQLKARDLYPDIAAPVFNPHGGWDSDRFFLTMINASSSGKIYYTTDGTDPRKFLTGNPVGAEYTGLITLTESTHVKARVMAGRKWSALNEAVFSVGPVANVMINEVLAHAHAGGPDWIELHNATDASVDIGGWFLSDSDSDLMKYEIAAGTIIESRGYVVFYEDLNFGSLDDPGCHVPFALSENGETLYLHAGASDAFIGYDDQEKFGASETGVALGRHRKSTGTYNFVAMSRNTPGGENAYPKVGPVVISEIMYNPASGNQDQEYIELLNVGSAAVTLAEYDNEQLADVPWRLTDDGGISFDFPLGVTMAPGEHLLLVKSIDAFNVAYPAVPGGVQIFEWGSGRLDNGGEKVQLSKPGDEVEGIRYYVRVDRVNYSDGSHPAGQDAWPAGPDGGGESLTRKVPTDYGNDPANWIAATPSPGR